MVTNVTNPTTAGGYGPFKLVSRMSQYGQIQDSNYVFGSVGIASTAGSISNLSLVYDSSSAATINLTSQKVQFTFTISRDLWKHDMFVITFDSKFQVASSVTCEAYKTGTSEIIYYNNTAGTHLLDCKETAIANTITVLGDEPVYTSQKLYIYGNANDIDITSTKSTTNTPLQNGA